MPYIKTWEELTIQDNFLFQRVMQNQRICKYLIEKILNITITRITYPIYEKTIDVRLDSKSIRLDVYVEDEKGTIYDIEMQCTSGNDGELAKRTRYYQGMMDMELLGKGKDITYDQLNKTFIIFICTFDLFGKGLPMYTFRHLCVEDTGIEMGDDATKIFLNSTSTSTDVDPDIAAFLQYVNGHAPKGEFTTSVDAEVKRIKEHKETRSMYMSLAMDLKMMEKRLLQQGRQEGKQEGLQEGQQKEKFAIAKQFLSMGLSKEQVAKGTGLSLAEVESLLTSRS